MKKASKKDLEQVKKEVADYKKGKYSFPKEQIDFSKSGNPRPKKKMKKTKKA